MIRRIAAFMLLSALLAVAGCQNQRHWASFSTEPIGPYASLSGPMRIYAYGESVCAVDGAGQLHVAFRTPCGAAAMLVLPPELSKAGLTKQLVEEKGRLYAAPGKAGEVGIELLAFRPSPDGKGLWVRAWAGPYRCKLTQENDNIAGTVVLDAWSQGKYAGEAYRGITRVTLSFHACVDSDRVAEIAASLESANPPKLPEVERFWLTPEEMAEQKRINLENRRKWLGLPATRPATMPK